MKARCIALLAATMLVVSAEGSLWTYDFGTDTGSFENTPWRSNHASAPAFPLPAPQLGGGSLYVYLQHNTWNAMNGGFYLENPGSGLGSGSELRATASDGGRNVFTFFGYDNPTATYSLGFTLRLSGADAGVWGFATGTGSAFNNADDLSSNQSHALLNFNFGEDNAIGTTYRAGGSTVNLPNDPFEQNVIYEVSIYGNNSTEAVEYALDNTTYTVSAGRYDLWVGSNRIANLQSAVASWTTLQPGIPIDSLMFVGKNSPDNEATLQLDDIWYANVIPEPGTLGLLLVSAAGLLCWRRRYG